MREWLNRADSKSVELSFSSVGSNPTLSGGQGFRGSAGEMTEWPKVYAWKAYVPLKGTVGSNPTLSVTPSVRDQALRYRPLPNPARTGR